ncbi:aminoacyl-tRNA hydrolase [bacterium]|nr:aminoacyl-tRNA hydrolase [bacterium]
MKLIVGLGNPGKKFINTRHNIGKEIIEHFAKIYNFPKFKFKKSLEVFVTKKKINNKKFILALPTTYMNESGRVVKKLLKYYKLIPNNLVIIHDEIDIPLGKIKLSFNRSSAGHKGVQSIINYLKTKEFYRLRIGIENRKEKRIPTEEYVLKKFSKEETRIINKLKEEIFRSLLK